MRIVSTLVLAVAVLTLLYVALRPRGFAPRGYPPIRTPADNLLTDQKVGLGRRLFYDRRLSFNGAISCADCHRQESAFSDPRARSIGATGESTIRNSMTLTNVAYNARYTWANDTLRTLEEQALIPLTHRNPLEMGILEEEGAALARLRGDRRYVELFGSAFQGEQDPIHLRNVVKAISSFVRTLVSANSPFDRYLAGDTSAISTAAQRGFELFRSRRLGCQRCHDGFNFRTTPGHRTGRDDDSVAYHNTGLYNLGNDGSYPATDRGLMDVTGAPDDMGRFKAPTLRNVAVSGPYMHDGSMQTLQEVVEHYSAGGRVIHTGPNAGDGRINPHKSPLITGFDATPQEKRDVVEFLNSLTDREFLTNRSLSNPFSGDR